MFLQGEGQSCRVIGVIPARWKSTRLLGKMLADLCGKPLIVRTYENAKTADSLNEIIVATDDDRIRKAIELVGGHVVMTDSKLPSGSDRVFAAIKDNPAEIVVNIQGDEPMLPPAVIDKTVKLILDNPEFEVTTSAATIDDEDIDDPNSVKVVLDSRNRALYFSRSKIPFSVSASENNNSWLRHIGLYVFRREILKKFCSWEKPIIEIREKLEQLRLLYHGVKIGVQVVNSTPLGIDTPQDLEIARASYKELK